MKKFSEKCPIAYGVIFGYGLSLLFVFFEYFLFSYILPSDSAPEFTVYVDSVVRIVFAVIALVCLKIFYKARFKGLFTCKVSKKHGSYVFR